MDRGVENTVSKIQVVFFFFQAEDGIQDAQGSRGLGDVYRRRVCYSGLVVKGRGARKILQLGGGGVPR